MKGSKKIEIGRVTFQRILRVMMHAARQYGGGQLPKEMYEDIQRVIVWMDNSRNNSWRV